MEELRKLGKDISIYSLDELYSQLENFDVDTENDRIEILAQASDDVIAEFMYNEDINAIRTFSEMNNMDDDNKIILDGEDDDYLNEVDVKYYQSNGDTKVVMETKTKYGTVIRRQMIDESDSVVSKKGKKWVLLQSWSEEIDKPYGDRRFTFNDESKIPGFSVAGCYSRFRYNISENGVVSNEIVAKGGTEKTLGYTRCISVAEKKVLDKKATKVGENIDGYVKFTTNYYSHSNPMADKTYHYKHTLIATIKKWDTKKKEMKMKHTVNEYVWE